MTRLVISIISIILIILVAVMTIFMTKSMINDTINEIEMISFDNCLLVENNWKKRSKFIKCFMNNAYLMEANKAIYIIKYSKDESEFSLNCEKAKEELFFMLENEKVNYESIF